MRLLLSTIGLGVRKEIADGDITTFAERVTQAVEKALKLHDDKAPPSIPAVDLPQ